MKSSSCKASLQVPRILGSASQPAQPPQKPQSPVALRPQDAHLDYQVSRFLGCWIQPSQPRQSGEHCQPRQPEQHCQLSQRSHCSQHHQPHPPALPLTHPKQAAQLAICARTASQPASQKSQEVLAPSAKSLYLCDLQRCSICHPRATFLTDNHR